MKRAQSTEVIGASQQINKKKLMKRNFVQVLEASR